MSLLTQLLIIIVSFSGFVFGIVLAFIAPEELKAGKIYFKTAAAVIFLLIILLGGYYFFSLEEYLISALFLIVMAIVFAVELSFDLFWLDLVNYLLFAALYFLISGINVQLLLASLIFLYGLPVGTLLKMSLARKKA